MLTREPRRSAGPAPRARAPGKARAAPPPARGLQQTFGNRAVQRLLDARRPTGDLHEDSLAHAAKTGTAPTRSAPVRPGRVAPRVQRDFKETLARFFGGGTFSDAELTAYLTALDKNKRIEDNFDSDNKARAIVARWQKGDAHYVLTLERKILLIEEMLSGFTGDDDEQAILTLLRGATNSEFSSIVSRVSLGRLQDKINGSERDELDAIVAARTGNAKPGAGGAAGGAAGAAAKSKYVFDDTTVSDAQQRFTANAEDAMRKNCIEIVRSVAPQLFSKDPAVAKNVGSELGKLKGNTLTMPHAGQVLVNLGVATGPTDIKFDGRNGDAEPKHLLSSAWDSIIAQVGKDQGWHVFGLAIFDGYHSVTVLVDNRADGPRVYWADQWRIDPGDDFHQQPGSVSGFRLYEKLGFDRFIEERTNGWWNDVHQPTSKCGKAHPKNWDTACRYTATLHIWHFRTQP